jgi:hypothetical protein
MSSFWEEEQTINDSSIDVGCIIVPFANHAASFVADEHQGDLAKQQQTDPLCLVLRLHLHLL